ncbi:MAG TPA: OmpA family protein [Candidatus Tectomicrobia bacterium]
MTITAEGTFTIQVPADIPPGPHHVVVLIDDQPGLPETPPRHDIPVMHVQVLSQKRADTVTQFMIAQGVNPSLVSAQGFGEANPVASNDTLEGRAKNRRVELTLAGAGN